MMAHMLDLRFPLSDVISIPILIIIPMLGFRAMAALPMMSGLIMVSVPTMSMVPLPMLSLFVNVLHLL